MKKPPRFDYLDAFTAVYDDAWAEKQLNAQLKKDGHMSAQLHIVQPYQPSEADMALESRMHELRREIEALQTEHSRLIKQRSPAFIDWLEMKQGFKHDK